MREIKLRAWDSEANIMVYSDHRTIKLYDVYYGFEMNENGSLECCWEGEFTESHALDGGKLDNIMQFTGLHDKYGVEIYEGDIVQMQWTIYDEPELFYIRTIEGRAPRVDNRIKGKELWLVHQDCKVVGNIYQNRELFEVAE